MKLTCQDAIALVCDGFCENLLDAEYAALGPGAVAGTATVGGRQATVIANDVRAVNPRFPVVYAGIIGLEEGYKMAMAVYRTIEADGKVPEKRPIVLVVDTPGNGPGRTEEIFGMNKATGAYQLALAQARQSGHPVLAVVTGRAISGAFLCHGMQADRIIALPKEFGTMIHVMPLSGIARITRIDIETLEALSQTNPVFASGAEYFHRLGGLEEIIEGPDALKPAVARHINEIYALRAKGLQDRTGPWSRGLLGAERGGRTVRAQVLSAIAAQFASVADTYTT